MKAHEAVSPSGLAAFLHAQNAVVAKVGRRELCKACCHTWPWRAGRGAYRVRAGLLLLAGATEPDRIAPRIQEKAARHEANMVL